jgi:anti-sigma regulatory factor (Ser/Thr protein kinase)
MNRPTDAAPPARPPTVSARFERRIEALPEIVRFTAQACAASALPVDLVPAVDLAVEELFTNMVKYGRGSRAPVRIEIAAVENGVEVTLIDADVEPFDVTLAPDADVALPLEQRRPGGLGLHLTRRMVEALDYRYWPERREARISFRKTAAAGRPSGSR